MITYVQVSTDHFTISFSVTLPVNQQTQCSHVIFVKQTTLNFATFYLESIFHFVNFYLMLTLFGIT